VGCAASFVVQGMEKCVGSVVFVLVLVWLILRAGGDAEPSEVLAGGGSRA
jgi:hypothetical protein